MSSSGDSGRARIRATLRDVHGGGRGGALLAIAGGWFLILGIRFAVPALLPFITADFPVSNATAGAAITLLWVTYGVIQFPAGALVDRVGERRLLVASMVLSVAGLVGYLGSMVFAVFLLATAAFGLGSGLFGPARGMVLTRTFPDRDGLAYGTVLAAGSIGAAAIPVGATILAEASGWRIAIGATVPGFLLVAVGLWQTVPSATAAAGPATDSPGTDGPETDGGSVRFREKVAAVRAAISSGGVAIAVVGATLMLFAFQGLTAFLTTYLVEAKGLTEGTAGLLFGLVFLAGAGFQWAGGGLADRFGHERVLALVAFLSVPPLVALPLFSGLIPLALVAAALGIRLSMSPISNAYIVSLLPVDVRGTTWGLLRTGFFTLGAFGSVAVGALADRNLFGEAFVLLAALTALAGVCYLFLPAREGIRA